MLAERVEELLREAGRASQEGRHGRCLELVQELKTQVDGQSTRDPVALSWAWFYELKSAYFLQQYERAWQLLMSGQPPMLTTKNMAYTSSIGAELAMHKERAEDVALWGRRCMHLRETDGDRVGIAQAAQTVCVLLAKLGRADLSPPFARDLHQLGLRYGAERAVIAGARFLLAAAAQVDEPALRREVWGMLDALRAIVDDRFSGEAIEVAQAIWNAPWLLESLTASERQRLERERRLFVVCGEGDAAEAARLVSQGVNVDARDAAGRTGLSLAAFAGHRDVCALLLARGASVELENSQRRTALILAADQGHAEVVELLLDHAANPDHAGICEQTALIVAGWQGHVETVRLLLSRGADPDLTDATGNTALTLAATEDQPQVVAAFVAAGVNVDDATSAGHTPLMKAAMEGQRAVARVLLEAGADASREDLHGMTARDWARQEGFHDLALELERAARRGQLH